MAIGRQKFMRRGGLAGLLIAASLGLPACLSTKVASLAPNMVRLNLVEEFAPTEQEALQSVMVLAATETISRGYDLFRFVDWTAGPAQKVTPGQGTVANFAVTVVMFHNGEQGQNPTFNAQQILQSVAPRN